MSAGRQGFAEALCRLRLLCGKPSFSTLSRIEPQLRPTTISDALNGRSRPTFEFVRNFVSACVTHAAKSGEIIDSEAADLSVWRERWIALNQATIERRAPTGRSGPPRHRDADTAPTESVVVRPAPVPHQLLADSRLVVGREVELQQIQDACRGPVSTGGVPKIVLVAGMAGVGKTTLVTRWAHRNRDLFPDGELWLDMRGFSPGGPLPADRALSWMLRSLDCAVDIHSDGVVELSAAFRSAIADRRMLIVLDDAASAEQVRPLLPASAGCVVLITSRIDLACLRVREGAHTIRLHPLPPPDATALLATASGSTISDAVGVEFASLCGGLPLALRIVADQISGGAQDQVLAALGELREAESRLSLLDSAPNASRFSVRSVFMWSYNSLDRQEQRAFRLLSVHPGATISGGALGSLAGLHRADTRRVVAGLVAAHLLENVGPDAYRMHDLLRCHARELCDIHDSPGDREQAIGRLLAWYLHSARAARRLMIPHGRQWQLPCLEPTCPPVDLSDRAQARAWIMAELDTVSALTDLATHIGCHEAAWILPNLTTFPGYGGLAVPWAQSLAFMARALESAERAGSLLGQGMSLNRLGNVLVAVRRYEEAAACYRRAADIYQEIGDRPGEALAWANLAAPLKFLGRFDEARAGLTRGLAVTAGTDALVGRASVVHSLAQVDFAAGVHDAAFAHASEALELFRRIDADTDNGLTLELLGAIEYTRGNVEEAIRLLRSAIRVQEDIDEWEGIASCSLHLGTILQAEGHHDAARRAYRRAREIFTMMGDPRAHDIPAHDRTAESVPVQLH
jgi:tetratricopeptide (TPR) repeat protein